MTYDDDELLPLSGIQHYSFCPRQWALIHVAQEWAENALTVQGGIVHKRAHDASLRERRGDTIELRCVLVDRFVVTSINNRVVSRKGFVELEKGEVDWLHFMGHFHEGLRYTRKEVPGWRIRGALGSSARSSSGRSCSSTTTASPSARLGRSTI
nr:Dna2/Cas4 domain-containing protein [Adlercreutzia caecimuris]